MPFKTFIYRKEGNAKKKKETVSRVQLNFLPIQEICLCSLLCLGLQEGCNTGVFSNPSQLLAQSRRASCSRQPSCPGLRGCGVSLQMCSTSSPWNGAPVTVKIRLEVFFGVWLGGFFFFRGFFVLHSCVFSVAEAVWANDKPNAADVWPVHIRGSRYGWQWLSRYVRYSGNKSAGETQQQAEKTAELVVSGLLVPVIGGGQWNWAFSSLSPLLFKAPDKNLRPLLNSGVWAIVMKDCDIKAEDFSVWPKL